MPRNGSSRSVTPRAPVTVAARIRSARWASGLLRRAAIPVSAISLGPFGVVEDAVGHLDGHQVLAHRGEQGLADPVPPAGDEGEGEGAGKTIWAEQPLPTGV
jgi:hypothetical protein